MKILAIPFLLITNMICSIKSDPKNSESGVSNQDHEKKYLIASNAYELIPNKYNMPVLNGASQNMEKMAVIKSDSSTHFHLLVKKEDYLIEPEKNIGKPHVNPN